MRGSALLLLVLTALAACAPTDPGIGFSRAQRVAESSASGEELVLVKAILSELQLRSFAENREFCGYVGLDTGGTWASTPVAAGDEGSCPLPDIPRGFTLVASFHTHGPYSPFYASEGPTTRDMASDASYNIDGYIATPGGRLWHVDSDTMTASQLCGRGCLPQDPAYVAAEDGPLRRTMTYAEVAAWERS